MNCNKEKQAFIPMSDELWLELNSYPPITYNPPIAYRPPVIYVTNNDVNNNKQSKKEKAVYSHYNKGNDQKSYCSILLLPSLCALLCIAILYFLNLL